MAFSRILQEQVVNGKAAAPSGAEDLITSAEGALYDLFYQQAWTSKEKFWFTARAATLNADGYIDTITGYIPGVDGNVQTLGRHPNAAATAQRVQQYTSTDSYNAMGNQYPVASGAGFGTLLSSSNALIPPAVSGVSKCTIAILGQQPIAHNGWAFTGDDMNDGSNQVAIGFSGTDDRYYAYTDLKGGKNGRTNPSVNGPSLPSQLNTGDLCLLVVELDGTITPTIRRSGFSLAISGTPTCGTVTSQRFRLGCSRIATGSSFDNPYDGIIEEVWAFPDVSSDIRLALKNFCIEKHPSMPFYG